MTRILHVSDTHGPIPWSALPNDFDVLVHSGDWMPEGYARDRAGIVAYQREFLRHEGACLAAWLKERPFVFCGGNHDLLSEDYMERELRSLGVEAFAPGADGALVLGRTFRGFRYVPWICGDFEGECDDEGLAFATLKVTERIWRDEILVAHCPPQGPLAGNAENGWGNRHLTAFLDADAKGGAESQAAPKLILCGHIHECGGLEDRVGDTRIVNAARTFAVVDV